MAQQTTKQPAGTMEKEHAAATTTRPTTDGMTARTSAKGDQAGVTAHNETQEVHLRAVKPLMEGEREKGTLSGNGFTYRHDWGDRHGEWRLWLNWPAVNNNSRVFVSVAEGGPNGSHIMGAAKFTLNNVVPYDNGVAIWVSINWDSNIRLYVDYLVINP